jgi:hypothetical protein
MTFSSSGVSVSRAWSFFPRRESDDDIVPLGSAPKKVSVLSGCLEKETKHNAIIINNH